MTVTLRGEVQGQAGAGYSGGVDEIRVYEARPGGPVVVGKAVPDRAGRFSVALDALPSVNGRRTPARFVEAYCAGAAVGRSAAVTSSDSNLAAIYVPITAANALVSATEVARHRERRAPSSDSGPVAKSHTGDGRRHGATTLRSETRAATADWRGFVESHVPSVAAQPTLIDEIARRMAADAEQGRLVRLPEGLQ